MICSAAADYLSRASTRLTCGASHVPRPVAVGTPRVLRALAMPCSDVTPAACISATMGPLRSPLRWRALRGHHGPPYAPSLSGCRTCRSSSTGCSWLRPPLIGLPSADERFDLVRSLLVALRGQSGQLGFVPIRCETAVQRMVEAEECWVISSWWAPTPVLRPRTRRLATR
jgi:hypothetical protein